MPKETTSPDAISDLINRARIAGKNNAVLQENIELEAGKLGLSQSLLLILEQIKAAAEEEAARKKNDNKDNAAIAVSAKALSKNDLSIQPEKAKDSFLVVLQNTLQGVSEGVKTAFLESRSNFNQTLQTRSVDERKALNKVVSADHIREKDIDRLKAMVKDPTIVDQSKAVVDNSRAVARDILTSPGASKMTAYTKATADQKARVNIINSDPTVLQAARVHGMSLREAVYKVEAMQKAIGSLKKAEKKEAVQDNKYLEEMQANVKLEKDWQTRDKVQEELLKPKALKKVETREQKFDLKSMYEAAKEERKFVDLIKEQPKTGHDLPPRGGLSI